MNLLPQYKELPAGTISLLCQAPSEDEHLLLQVYNISISKNHKLTALVSDGTLCAKAFFQNKDFLTPEKHENCIIQVKSHMVANSGKSIGIIEAELVCQYSELLGNPRSAQEITDAVPEEKSFALEPRCIKTCFISMQEKGRALRQSNNTVKLEAKEVKKEEKRQMRIPDAKPLNGSVKDYETIKGLFVGLKNWHLLCRVCSIDYNEFKKKNSDKMVQMLTIELIDRSDVKISGYFFYETAQKFRNILKLNSVYKITEGSIANESYNNSKNQKFSPFKLMFHINSQFEEVSDYNIIAKSEDSAVPLGELLNKSIFDQQFDILGILVNIEEPKEITKDGRTLTLENWVIVDPIEQKKVNAVLWNSKIKADQSLVGKTLILSRFTLHNYNGCITINSKVRSNIQVADYPAFQRLHDHAMQNHHSYEMLSERKMREEQTEGIVYKNLKELNYAMDTLITGETLRTDLDIFVNRLMTRKWFYEGCPSCNKAAEKGMSCHCGKYVEQTVPHFIMGVELSDAFGSVFSTAYDDQAKKIFWEEEGVIHKLLKCDENQIKNIVEDYYYQEFKVRIYTKKDNQGRIKHNMGKLESIAPEKAAMENVERIRQMMENSMM